MMETETVQNVKKQSHYKYCIVPKCRNTTVNAAEKHFFTVPKDKKRRNKWYKMMKRNIPLSEKSVCYCCEDHFDVETDTENFMRHRLMGGILFLKKNVSPHKFACQSNKIAPQERSAFTKRRRAEFLAKVLSPEIPVSVAQQPIEFIEVAIKKEEIKEDIDPIFVPAENSDANAKAIEEVKKRNRGVQINIKPKTKDQACQTRFRPKCKKCEERETMYLKSRFDVMA